MNCALFGLLLALAFSITTQEVNRRQPKQFSHLLFNPYYGMDMPRAGLHYQQPAHYGTRFDFLEGKFSGIGQGRNGGQNSASSSSTASELEQANVESDYADAGRFFYGSNIGTGVNVGNNFLIKTSYAFTTSTATVCSLVSCIPAVKFAPGSSNVLCRRRRNVADVVSIMHEAEDLQGDDILPSAVEKVETTKLLTLADPNFRPVPEDKRMVMSPYPILLETSMMEKRDDQNDHHWGEKVRQKRFAFILTTTIVSYELSTATYTVTVNAGLDGLISCRPSKFAVC